jgi:hypothetical protein
LLFIVNNRKQHSILVLEYTTQKAASNTKSYDENKTTVGREAWRKGRCGCGCTC